MSVSAWFYMHVTVYVHMCVHACEARGGRPESPTLLLLTYSLRWVLTINLQALSGRPVCSGNPLSLSLKAGLVSRSPGPPSISVGSGYLKSCLTGPLSTE